jgi:hypothetical protein
MKAKLLHLCLLFVLLYGCKKDRFTTKPQLKIKDIKASRATYLGTAGAVVVINFEVTDKEGDVKDSIFMQKIDAASIPCPNNSILANLDYQIPNYPSSSNQKVLFRVSFSTLNIPGYALISGSACPPRADTSVFRFIVKDRAGNRSDTLTTDRIAIPN